MQTKPGFYQALYVEKCSSGMENLLGTLSKGKMRSCTRPKVPNLTTRLGPSSPHTINWTVS